MRSSADLCLYGYFFSLRAVRNTPVQDNTSHQRSWPACSHVISLPAISPALCAHKEQFPEWGGAHQISSMQVKILSVFFFFFLFPFFSVCLQSHHLSWLGLLSERWLLLIKELIFFPLSLISIVNLKHCEFFKFSFPVIKKRKRRIGDI